MIDQHVVLINAVKNVLKNAKKINAKTKIAVKTAKPKDAKEKHVLVKKENAAKMYRIKHVKKIAKAVNVEMLVKKSATKKVKNVVQKNKNNLTVKRSYPNKIASFFMYLTYVIFLFLRKVHILNICTLKRHCKFVFCAKGVNQQI
jgi:hypothetical protein